MQISRNRKDAKFRKEFFSLFRQQNMLTLCFQSVRSLQRFIANRLPPRSTLRGAFDLRVPRNEGRLKVQRNWRGVDDDSVEDILIAGFAYYSRYSSVARGQWLAMGVQSHRSRGKVGFVSILFPVSFPPNHSLSLFSLSLSLLFHHVFKTSSLRSLSQKLGLSFTIGFVVSFFPCCREIDKRTSVTVDFNSNPSQNQLSYPAISV